ncbi:MAG: lipoyl(octanoyl) transferase LipB [Agarilytica sp.]
MQESESFIVKDLGLSKYQDVWQAMREFTNARDAQTGDEIWFTQHYPVFTQGQAGKPEHVLAQSDIPLVQTDRGGQVTYHAPGQLITYFLLDLKRRKMGVRELVTLIENSVVSLLREFKLAASAKPDAPGVYVNDSKIASLGLRVRKGCSYHGLAINVNMNLEPFSLINPCGYPGLEIVDVNSLVNEELGAGPTTVEHVQALYLKVLKGVLARQR